MLVFTDIIDFGEYVAEMYGGEIELDGNSIVIPDDDIDLTILCKMNEEVSNFQVDLTKKEIRLTCF